MIYRLCRARQNALDGRVSLPSSLVVIHREDNMLPGEEKCPWLNVQSGTLYANSNGLAIIFKSTVNQTDCVSFSLAQIDRLCLRYQLSSPQPTFTEVKLEPPLVSFPPP
jgi:hypothetical protein